MQKETYHENQQNEMIFKRKDACAKYTLEKRAHPSVEYLDNPYMINHNELKNMLIIY